MSTAKFNTWLNPDGTENYKCRAWVNFDGTTTTPTIRASGNVSSVTKNSTGLYTVNFTTAMPDANYSVASTSNHVSGSQSSHFNPFGTGTFTTSAVQVRNVTNGAVQDVTRCFVQIFR